MQSLKSMQLSKKEMKEIKGARWTVGANTEAWGDGSNGAMTLLDGDPWMHDNSSGSLFGDSWSYYRTALVSEPGTIKISQK